MINKIDIKNFQLFQVSEINFGKINIVEGINQDDLANSSNGAGKSTLAKHAITFCLYGDVKGTNLKDLLRIGTKEAEIALTIRKGNDTYRIIRTIPSSLKIMLNGKEVQGNTNTIKQKYIDDVFGNYDNFLKFRMIDNKGINLLDLGIVSLRKELMNFVDGLFTDIRKNLLAAKLERENFNKDKRFYKFYLSEKRLDILKKGLESISNEATLSNSDCMEQFKVISKIKSEIQSREKLIYYKEQDKKKLNGGICPILGNKCPSISGHLEEVDIIKNKEIQQLQTEIKEFQNQLNTEGDLHTHYTQIYNNYCNKHQKIQSRLMKLQEAFKFKEYRFTTKDVMLYTEAIKTLDTFAGWYINDWLSQLSIIINDLLKNVNLQVEFNTEKDFIRIKNGDKELGFEQLSSGQKTFLSSVFKLAMLLHRGENEGIIIADEGLGAMDEINFKKFVEICKTLPFQFFIIFHGAKNKIEDVNYIKLIRKDGITQLS